MTAGAKKTWELECDIPLEDLISLADVVHEDKNLAAAVSSGSYVTDGMIIMPCSMKTLAGITAGYAENLMVRAADVCMKEGRKVVLVPREMPFSRLHLRNLKTLEDQINHIVGKVLMQFGITHDKFVPWTGADE